MPPSYYGDWLRHLVMRGNTIIYPVCQSYVSRPEEIRDIAFAGITAGLRAVDADPNQLVVVGNTSGGALAFDYAALAKGLELPQPRAVFAVYPARNPPGGEIPSADLAQIPSFTHLEVVAGPADPLPEGTAQARAMLAEATRVPPRLRHFIRAPYRPGPGPLPTTTAPRRSYWGPADRLIARAREGRA